MNAWSWAAVVVAGLVSLTAPFALRSTLRRLGVLDVPNQRSSHSTPTLRGGGAAPLLGLIIGGAIGITMIPGQQAATLLIVLAAGVIAGVVGLVEDLRGLRVPIRAVLQFAVGAGVAVVLGASAPVWFWIPLAALFFAAHVNFTNFMDGINGISSVHGLVAGVAYAFLGGLQGLAWLQLSGLLVACAFVAFLPWNLLPPGMFLGDVGSYLLGGVLGATALAALAAGLNPLAAVAPLVIYWVDAVSTLAKRALRRERIFDAHRSHAYQRLVDAGMPHASVAVLVALFVAATSVVSLLAVGSVVRAPVAAWMIVIALAAAYLGLPKFYLTVVQKES